MRQKWLKQRRSSGVEVDKSMGRGKLIDEIFEEKCEEQLIQPTFITDYPGDVTDKRKTQRARRISERFESHL